jgi:hypothetical protein
MTLMLSSAWVSEDETLGARIFIDPLRSVLDDAEQLPGFGHALE